MEPDMDVFKGVADMAIHLIIQIWNPCSIKYHCKDYNAETSTDDRWFQRIKQQE